MMDTSFSLGPLNIPLKIILLIGAAGTAHLLLHVLKRKESGVFKKASDLFFNSVLIYFAGWRLSLILTNWSTFKRAPTAVLYLPGGFLNHTLGAAAVVLWILLFYRASKISRAEVKNWFILTGVTLLLYFMSTTGISFLTDQSQLLDFTPPQAKIPQADNTDDNSNEKDSESRIILLTIDGKEQALDLTGSPVTIVNFWASWCPPCRAEFPEISRFFSEYKDKEMRFITINLTSTEKSAETVLEFIRNEEALFPVLLDTRGEAAAGFAVNSVPSTFVFNNSGELIAQRTGAVDYSWLAQAYRSAYQND